MASVRTRDKDSMCYSTQNVWVCYELKMKPSDAVSIDAINLAHRLDYTGEWDLTRPADHIRVEHFVSPSYRGFMPYAYETEGFSVLISKAVGGSGFPHVPVESRFHALQYRKTGEAFYEFASYIRQNSRVENFATYEGAKNFCEGQGVITRSDGVTSYSINPVRVTTCEVDYTRTVHRELNMTRERTDLTAGERFYPKGAKVGSKIIVGTWIDEENGELNVRWAESHPVYSDARAFLLVASG